MDKKIIFFFLATIIFFACEEKNDSPFDSETEIHYGIGVDLEDYFYGFYSDSDVSAKYLVFNEIQLGDELDPDPETDTLNLRSFNDAEYL